MSSTDSNAPQYDCDVCGSGFPDTAGVLACEEHFYCNDCAIEVFHRSMTDINEFPASCCSRSRNGLPPALFTDLLGKEFMDKYLLKLTEYYTPEAARVYCANPQCAKFHHPQVFNHSDHLRTTAPCECGTTTCVGCKAEYHPEHRCLQLDPTEHPAWLPEYTALCRIKQCPHCREWIQLLEACNHMTCTFCHHQFCFICLLPWTGFNHPVGCPSYGDPPEGYDRDGFERTPRAIHLLTGRNRNGDTLNEMPEFLNANMPNPDEDADDIPDLLNAAPYLAAHEAVDAQREDELHGIEEIDEWIRERNEWLAERDELLEQVRLQDEQIAHVNLQIEQVNLQMEQNNLALLEEEVRLAEQERLHFEAMQAPEPGTNVFAGEIDTDEADLRDPDELARLQRILNISDDEDEGEEEAEQDDTLDFGLEMMFENEQDLHDQRHPTIQLAGLATSGVLQCSIAVHENPFSMLEEADD